LHVRSLDADRARCRTLLLGELAAAPASCTASSRTALMPWQVGDDAVGEEKDGDCVSRPEALLRRTHGDHIAGGWFLAPIRARSRREEARGVVSWSMRARA
jgi:hypothetical protein